MDGKGMIPPPNTTQQKKKHQPQKDLIWYDLACCRRCMRDNEKHYSNENNKPNCMYLNFDATTPKNVIILMWYARNQTRWIRDRFQQAPVQKDTCFQPELL